VPFPFSGPAGAPARRAAPPAAGFDQTRRAVRALRRDLRELDRTNDARLRRLRRATPALTPGEAWRAETELFQDWRAGREALEAEIRRLTAALADPRRTP
jgi:hypothetical protein